MSLDPVCRPTMADFSRVLREESEWLLHRTKPRSAPNWSHEAPAYSLSGPAAPETGTILSVSVNPRIRVDKLNQDFYWVEVSLKRKRAETVWGLHELLLKHVGPFYNIHLAYGEWGFLISFWGLRTKTFSALWTELAGRVDSARVLRCNDCYCIEGDGNVEAPRARRNVTVEAKRAQFLMQRDLYHYQCQKSNAEYMDRVNVDELIRQRVLLTTESEAKMIRAVSYISFEKSGERNTPENTKRLVFPEILRAFGKNEREPW